MAWKRVLMIALLCLCCAGARAETIEPPDLESSATDPLAADTASVSETKNPNEPSFVKLYFGKTQKLEPLDFDSEAWGPAPKDKYYISDTEYQDDSISVKLYFGKYGKTDYVCAHVKISDASQLRTTASSGNFFRNGGELTGTNIAANVNAVVAINGDYYTKTDKCRVVMRQCRQVRNLADGTKDLLVVDKQGNFSALLQCTGDTYKQYLKKHQSQMYNVFCFGPVLVQDGKSVIPDTYKNGYIGAENETQRAAIAQLGPLEYMLIACNGPQSGQGVGLKIVDFAALCEKMGKQLNENGCLLAYNLDGGNSAELLFKNRDKSGNLTYIRMNSPDIGERGLSDIIYFATLVK